MPVAAIMPFIAAGSAIMQYKSSSDAAKAQKQSIAAQKKIADVQTARERVTAARQARMARASVLASAGNEGIGGSGVEGAVSSIGSQYGSNIANINTMQTFGAQASAANQKAVDAQASAAMWQGIGGFARGMTDWTKIFNPSGTPSVSQMANK